MPEVVLTSELSPLINEFIRKFDIEHPRNPGVYEFGSFKAAQEIRGFGGVQYLATEMARATGKTKGYCDNQIRKARYNKTRYTSLKLADEILTALGGVYRLDVDVEVITIPNNVSFKVAA